MEFFLKLYAPVNPFTSIQVQRNIEQALLQGMKTLHLLLSTPGGSVHDGISIYNLLKGLPITVNTYNFGSVDSIGVVLFCAGTNRYSVPHARFLLHPVSMQMMGNQVLDEPSIGERLKLLRADEQNIASIISCTINKKTEDVFTLIHNRTTLDPENAKKEGLVTEIKSDLVPSGASLVSIYDNQNQQQFMPMQMPMGLPLRGTSAPIQNGETAITNSHSSIYSADNML